MRPQQLPGAQHQLLPAAAAHAEPAVQQLLHPHVHREGRGLFAAEQQHAVRHLVAHAGKGGQQAVGRKVVHVLQLPQRKAVQHRPRRSDEIGRAIAHAQAAQQRFVTACQPLRRRKAVQRVPIQFKRVPQRPAQRLHQAADAPHVVVGRQNEGEERLPGVLIEHTQPRIQRDGALRRRDVGKLLRQRAVIPIQIEEVPQLRRIHAAPCVHAVRLLPQQHGLSVYHAREAVLQMCKVKALGTVHQAQPQVDFFAANPRLFHRSPSVYQKHSGSTKAPEIPLRRSSDQIIRQQLPSWDRC